MTKHIVADHLLRASIGIKVEAGVKEAMITALINKFAARQSLPGSGNGTIGVFSVEDIPQHRRAEFLSALDWLSENAK